MRDRLELLFRGVRTSPLLMLLLAMSFSACGFRGPSSHDLAALRAGNAVEEGQWELARRYTAEALETPLPETPDDQAVHLHRLAAEAWSKGPSQSLGRALEHWTAVLAIHAEDAEARLGAARSHVRLGSWDEAISLLEGTPKSLDRDRLLAEALAETDESAARSFLESAVTDSPDESALWALLARVCAGLDDSDCVVEAAVRATEINPFDRRSYYLRGRFGGEEVSEILELLTVLEARRGPTQPTSLERLRALNRMLELIPGDPPLGQRLNADLLIESGLAAQARELLPGVLAQSPDDPKHVLYVAGLAERAGDLRGAKTHLLEVEERATSAAAHREVVHRLSRIDRDSAPQTALARLEASVAEDPDVARHQCMLGLLHQDAGRHEVAEKHLTRAVELGPWKLECRLALAGLLHERGERAAVAGLLDAAVDPESTAQFRSQYGY